MSGNTPKPESLSIDDIRDISAVITKNGLIKNTALFDELMQKEDSEVTLQWTEIEAIFESTIAKEINLKEIASVVIRLNETRRKKLYQALIKALPQEKRQLLPKLILEEYLRSQNEKALTIALLMLGENKNLIAFLDDPTVFALALPFDSWHLIFYRNLHNKDLGDTVSDMVNYALKYNNVNLYLAAIKIFLHSQRGRGNIATIFKVLEEQHFDSSIFADEANLALVKQFLYALIAARENLSNELFAKFFTADLNLETDRLLEIFVNTGNSPYATNLVRKFMIANLAEAKIVWLLRQRRFFNIDFKKDFWQTLLQRNLAPETTALLFDRAIAYNKTELIMSLVEHYMQTDAAYLTTLIPKANSKILRLVLSEISKKESPHKDQLWHMLQTIFKSGDAELLKSKINAWALVDEQKFPIDVTVMLKAQDLFGLTAKITELGKSDRNYNPIILQVLPIDKEPTILFKHYLENYREYAELFNPLKDVESKDRFNLFKYLLYHYDELKNYPAYETIIDMLLDEDIFAKIDKSFINEILGYDAETEIFAINHIDPKIVEKIFVPLGFKLNDQLISDISGHPAQIGQCLINAPLNDTNSLTRLLAAELVVDFLMPEDRFVSGAQSAHNQKAEANFDNFKVQYAQHNLGRAITANEQVNYIKLFVLHQLYKANPNHELFTKFPDSAKIKSLLQTDNYARVYEDYLQMVPKNPLLEYVLNPEQAHIASLEYRADIDRSLGAKDANFYAEQALITLRGLNDQNNHILKEPELCAGTAHLIQYMQADASYLQDKFSSHADVAKALFKLILDDKQTALSSDRQELFELYLQHKSAPFSYAAYAPILEKIFLTRLKNNLDLFCPQIADAVTAYQHEEQQPNSSQQSCITGYKSRLNQLLDADILYGRSPGKLELMQEFLVERLQSAIQKKIDDLTSDEEKREFLGQYLSIRNDNAALMAAGKETEMLNYFGSNKLEFPSLAKLFEFADEREFYMETIKIFQNDESYNPEKKQLLNSESWSLFNLLIAGGGEVVIKKLDKIFRPKYGVQEKATSPVANISKEEIIGDVKRLENHIIQKQADFKHMSQNMMIIRSQISQLVVKIMRFKYGNYNENDAAQEAEFATLKAELSDFVYPKEANKVLAPDEFQNKVRSIMSTIQPTIAKAASHVKPPS